MKIIPLHEGVYAVDKQKNFKLLADKNSIPGTLTMAVCPFLIVLADDVILLDAGLGFVEDGISNIKKLLQENGFETTDITKVLISHLHKDHVSGLFYESDGAMVPHFQEAPIYIQRKEFDYALTQKESPSFDHAILESISKLENIVWMDKTSGKITDSISFEMAGGHSPFHQAFWITEDSETAFFGGDNLPQKSYLRFHVAYKTDDDGKKAMSLREKWEKEAKEKHWTVLFYHDIKNNATRF